MRGRLSCFFLSVVADCNFLLGVAFLFIFVLSLLAVFAASADVCIASLRLLFNVAQFHVVSQLLLFFNAPPPLVISKCAAPMFPPLSYLLEMLYTYNIW